MSLSRPDRLYLSIEPDRIAMARCRGWLQPRIEAEQVIENAGAGEDAASAVARLDEILSAGSWAGAAVHVVLSDQLVKSFVCERVAGLRRLRELRQSAAARFEETFGDAASDWEMCIDLAAFAPRFLVSAVDRRLLDALRGVLVAHRLVPISIRPFMVSEFNRRHRHLGSSAIWFAVAERASLTLAWVAKGSWRTVRTFRTDGDPLAALPRLLARERLTHGTADAAQPVRLSGSLRGDTAGNPNAPAILPLGQAVWPGRSEQWSRDYRLALSEIWP